MAADDEIAMMLPDPPPPRPDRRTAAIAEAMRRFDGEDASAPAAPVRRPAATRAPWVGIRKGQVGLLASVALVAVIAIPIALYSPERSAPPPHRQASTEVGRHAAAPGAASPAGPAPVPTRRAEADTALAAGRPQAGLAPGGPAAKNENIDNRQVAALIPPSPPPPPAPAPEPAPMVAPSAEPAAKVAQANAATAPIRTQAMEARGRVAHAERADAFARPAPAPAAPPPAAMASNAEDRDDDAANIIVTGSRRDSPALYRRGDWNACTVGDPEQSLDGCRRLVDPGAKGVAGRADAQLATGLSLAWDGDMEGAIAAFGRAIALRPRFAFAYLNRGIAYQRDGDLDRALLDFNRSIRYAPDAARGYLHRSLLLREKGDKRGARADAARAISLDIRYRSVLK